MYFQPFPIEKQFANHQSYQLAMILNSYKLL